MLRMAQAIKFVCAFCWYKSAKMSERNIPFAFGTEVEGTKMSGERLSCLKSEQEKPEPVEK